MFRGVLQLALGTALVCSRLAAATPPPFVLSQPADLNLPTGASATLSVSATGSGLSYQWYKDGSSLLGGTGASWTINNASAPSAGHYWVVVSDAGGSSTSRRSTVTVQPPVAPVITTGVQGGAMASGSSGVLSVTVTGTPPLSYQWAKDGNVVGTSATLALNSVKNADAGTYSVTVSNAAGSATSSAPITITAPSVTITQQPGSEVVPFGESVILSVTATGAAPLTYQWYFNGTPVSQITPIPSEYYAGKSGNGTSGTYTVLVTAGDGSSVMSDPAVIGVSANPVGFYLPLPSAVTVVAGTRAIIGGWGAYGRNLNLSSEDTYQINGIAKGSIDSGDGIDTPIVQSGDVLNVTVIVTGYSGVATSTCVVTAVSGLTAAPIISEQPPPFILLPPAPNSINVSASAMATGPISAQWYKDGVPVGPVQNASGNLTATYTNNAPTTADSGSYTCTFTGGGVSVTTAACPVTVPALAAPQLSAATTKVQATQGGILTIICPNSGGTATYQWYKDGNPIAGATQNSYTSYTVTPQSAGSYHLVASNAAATVTGPTITVTVVNAPAPTPPVLVQQPVSQTVLPGIQVQFAVTANGDSPFSYQWYKGGQAIPFAITNSYTLTPQLSDAGSYTVVVSNGAGSVTSTAALLSVIAPTPPVIIAQPSDQTVALGGAATFSVQASGATTYQWLKNGTSVPGANGTTLTISGAAPSDAAAYSVRATNAAGSATSSAANLAVATVPTISAQPASLSVPANSPAIFSISAAASGTTTYQWFENGTALQDGAGISGSTSSTLTLTATSPGALTVQVSNAAGSIMSSAAQLTIDSSAAPVFLTITNAETVSAGSSVTLTGSFSASPAPTYQWFFNGSAIPGATLPSYSIPAAQPSDAGSYTITATNGLGSATSIPSILNVTQAPIITLQPVGATVAAGASYTFSAAATASPAASFQWMLNGSPIPGATGASYSVPNASVAASGSYTVTASNSTGTATSRPAWLVVTAGSGGPSVASQPLSHTISAGDSVILSVSLTGTVTTSGSGSLRLSPRASGTVSYQWYLNGVPIPGATDATYVARAASAGAYTCLITTATGSLLSDTATVTVVQTSDPGRLVNLSTLSFDGSGDQKLTLGFVTGNGAAGSKQPLLIRVVGPGLSPYGVQGRLADPMATLYSGQSAIGGNSVWTSSAANQLSVATTDAAVGAFPLLSGSADAAFVTSLNGGPYTVEAASRSGGSGNALAEIYDATANFAPGTTPRLINLSCLQAIPAGGILTAGFVIGGTTAKTLLIRASGPALTAYGLTGVMPDPTLTVFSGQAIVAQNAGWSGGPWISQTAKAVGAFAFTDTTSADSALALSLSPGIYTVQAKSASGTKGLALIEVYEVP